jgi:hypothetical protein
MVIAVHTPFYTIPRKYVADVMYVNVIRTAEFVRILFL